VSQGPDLLAGSGSTKDTHMVTCDDTLNKLRDGWWEGVHG
jgi:hypothetical protein